MGKWSSHCYWIFAFDDGVHGSNSLGHASNSYTWACFVGKPAKAHLCLCTTRQLYSLHAALIRGCTGYMYQICQDREFRVLQEEPKLFKIQLKVLVLVLFFISTIGNFGIQVVRHPKHIDDETSSSKHTWEFWVLIFDVLWYQGKSDGSSSL